MSHTVLERTAIPVPATRDLREQARRLAPVGLAFLFSVGAAAYRHHWWLLPVRSGHELRVESEAPEAMPSESRSRQGLINKVRRTTLNRNDDAVQVVVANLIVRTTTGRNFRQPRVRPRNLNRV